MKIFQLMIKTMLVFFSLFFFSYSFGQYFNRYGRNADTLKIFAINMYRYQIDSSSVISSLLHFSLDSIDVSEKKFENKSETVSIFQKSKSVLRIKFYFRACKLILAYVEQQSPYFSDLNAYSVFYFEKDSIFYSDYYF